MRGKNPVDQGSSKTWLRVSLANLSPYVPSDNLLVHQLSRGEATKKPVLIQAPSIA